MIGKTIGNYEITALLGKGGMGEVYRARDTRLKREVAIKVLPDEFSRDHDRVGRFLREAEVLATLNHPNIAAIHDLQEAGDSRLLVLELVEGETLADRIKRGPLPLDEALDIAKQICEALEAAHEKGIIHRDLKPANIKLTPDGKVKVLDFGLAKAVESTAIDGLRSNSPTLSMAATQQGIILGTAAYMSPEQARGRRLDRRSDIFSLGCVIYEMLTGIAAFQGEDVAETLGAVLKTEPEWSRVPVRFRRVLQRCMEKDPRKRFHDTADVSLLLDETPEIPSAKTEVFWKAATGVFALLCILLGALLWPGTPPIAAPLVRLNVDLGPDVSLPSQSGMTGTDVIISRDGTRLAYVSQARLFTRSLDQVEARELPTTEGAYAPFFSPDGRWLGFFAQGKLKKISVEGGSAIPLCDAVNARGGSWTDDGNIVVSLAGTGFLQQISAAGGTAAVPLTELRAGEVSHRWPQVLPGSNAVVFTSHSSVTDWDNANIEVVSLRDHRRQLLQRGATFGRYFGSTAGTGYLTYVSRGTLFAVPFDANRLEVQGSPFPVLSDVGYSNNFGFGRFDFADNGTFVYRSGAADGEVTVDWLDETGKTQPLLTEPGFYKRPRLSPDGQRLALARAEGGNFDIWIYELQRDAWTKLTFGDAAYDSPVWTPDGQYIAFLGPGGMFWARSDGAGKPQRLTQSKGIQYPFSFAPDGKRLAFSESANAVGSLDYDLWTLPVEATDAGLRPGKPEVFLKTNHEERHPSFSRDGRWMAYASNESGTFQIYVRPFPDNGGRGWQISYDGGVYPVFARNGHDLFFRTEDNQIMVAAYSAGNETFVANKPRLWSPTPIADLGIILNYDLAADGERIVALMPQSTELPQAQNHVTFLLNFFDELRRRAGR